MRYLLPLLPMPEIQISYRLWPQCISLRQEEGSTGLVISYCHIPGENLPVLHRTWTQELQEDGVTCGIDVDLQVWPFT